MKKSKKLLGVVLTATLSLLTLAGCGGDAGTGGTDTENQPITVISREDGSGTRGAFIELFGVEVKDAKGNKEDMTIETAEITNSTSVMMTSVAGDPSAIGYISLGSLNDTVKALSIDGVAPSAESIVDGTYAIARPFNVATKGDVSPVAQDFLDFIFSADGQAVVESKGYVPVENTGAYAGNLPSGKVVVAGSSSVTPVMEALKEAYTAINPNASIEVQQSDSTTGMNSVDEGICDIGMASRDLKDSEIEKGLVRQAIAMDGIAVIVNLDNPISDLTNTQVKDIYTGVSTLWSDLK